LFFKFLLFFFESHPFFLELLLVEVDVFFDLRCPVPREVPMYLPALEYDKLLIGFELV
jgi:hypothetical protein